MKSIVKRFLNEEDGAQMSEYALLVVLIGLAVAAAAIWLSGEIRNAFDTIAACISGNAECPTSP
jgi:Flp pilus assembly pilin Flp